MLFFSIFVFLSTALAFIPRPYSRKVALFHKSAALFSSVGDEDFIKSEPQELFWITQEGLSLEVLATDSTLVVEKQPLNERVYGSVVRFFKRVTNNAEKRVPVKQKAPILFIHGSFHAAWCFAEHYLDFFSALGHQCYAVSLRGTSTTGMPPQDPGETVRIEQHVADMKCALSSLKASMKDRADGMETPDPIIVSHSFGGVIVMKLLEDEKIRQGISGACFLCSVPPSGNGPMIQRFLKTKFLSSLKIVWGFVFKAVSIDLPNCRELFFDKTVPAEDIEIYMTRFRADSRVGLDLQSLDAALPSATSSTPEGRAVWLPRLYLPNSPTYIMKEDEEEEIEEPSGVRIDMDSSTICIDKVLPLPSVSTAPSCPSILVIGAEKDFIVDKQGVRETARYLGVIPVFIPGGYHDVMLGPKWRLSANIIADWLTQI